MMNRFFTSVKFTPKKLILLAGLVVILVNACKKEVAGIFAGKQAYKADVQWAKDYYQQRLLPKQANFMSIRGKAQMNTSGSTGNPVKEIFLNWELAEADTTNIYEFVEIPLKSNFISRPVFQVTRGAVSKPVVDEKTLNAGFDRLIIYKNRNDVINQRIVSYVPDKDYVNRHNGNISHNTIKNLDPDFFGYLEYKDWNGNTMFVLRIENGRSVKRLTNRMPVAGISMQKMNAVPNAQKLMVEENPGNLVCETITQSHQERWCYYENWWDETPYRCDPWETIIDGQYEVCTDPNGGGGGTTDFDDPSDDIEPLPCEDVSEPDLTDTIQVQLPIMQEALKKMLPYAYYDYIEFDNSGNLNEAKLLSAKQNAGLPESKIYKALTFLVESDVNISVYLKLRWVGLTNQVSNNPNQSYYFDMNGQYLDAITVVPAKDPITNVPVTGSITEGAIYINSAKNSSLNRLAYLSAHELIGHMYRYIKNLAYTHNQPEFNGWLDKILSEANKNWKEMKKWEKSKNTCPQN